VNVSTVKTIAKRLAEKISSLLIFPAWLGYQLEAALLGRERACMGVCQSAALWRGTLGVYRRRILFKRILARTGDDLFVAFGSVLTKPTIEFGSRVYIGSYCMLGDVRIGDDTMLADHICIPSGSGQHGIARLDIPMQEQPGEYHTIYIGEDC